MANQALFLRRVFLRQRNSLRVVANDATLFRLTPILTFFHGLIKGLMLVIERDWLCLLTGGAHDEHYDHSHDNNDG